MQTIVKNINYDLIKKILDGNHDCSQFSRYSKIYPFTNEPLYIYFDTMNFKNKSVLSVTASGDHPLGAIAEGASSVDCFDINILTEYYYYFKKAAIQSFTYNEYMNYFISLIAPEYSNLTDEYNQKFILDGYMLLREKLNEEVRKLWDFIIIDSNIEFTKRMENLFRGCPVLHIGTSITEEQYNNSKKILPNYSIDNFFDCNITSLSRKLEDRKYDYMLLSNIGDYIIYKEYSDILSKLIINNLNDKGKIALFSFKFLEELQEEQADYRHELPFTIENYSLGSKGAISIVRKRYK